MITFKQKGDFRKTDSFFERVKEIAHLGDLDKYGRLGVEALRSATPRDTGKTANSWYYQIVRDKGSTRLVWCNSNTNDGMHIAVLIQYGHGLQNGYRVEGIDYINPAMINIFEDIGRQVWEEVTRA